MGKTPPSGNVVKCICALVVNALFSQPVVGFWGKAPNPYGSIPGPRWGTLPQTLNLPTLGKNRAGAHALY